MLHTQIKFIKIVILILILYLIIGLITKPMLSIKYVRTSTSLFETKLQLKEIVIDNVGIVFPNTTTYKLFLIRIPGEDAYKLIIEKK